jgi:ATP-binding cassette subfamily B protein
MTATVTDDYEDNNQLSQKEIEMQKIPDNHFKWLLQQIFKKKGIASFIMIGSLILVGLNMVRPILLGQMFDEMWIMYKTFIDEGIRPSLVEYFGFFPVNLIIVRYGVIILILGVVSVLFGLAVGILNEYLAQRTERDIREQFYSSVQSKSMTFHDTAKVGDLMSQATFDVRIINATVSPGLRMISQLLVTTLFAFGTIFYYDWRVGLSLIVYIPFYAWTAISYSRKIKPLTEKVQKQFGDCNAILQENVSGIRVVRAFTAEKHETKKFMKEINTLRDDIIARGKQQALYFPPMILSVAIATSLGLSVLFIRSGTMTGGNAITIIGSLVNLYDPTYQISWVLYLTHMGLAGAKRIIRTMKEKEIIKEKTNAIELEEIKGSVEYNNVSFSYQKLLQQRQEKLLKENGELETEELLVTKNIHKKVRDTLTNINFKVDPGDIVAILGPTGCGKSTLTKLLARMYDVDKGKILIDGIDIRNIKLESLRKNIGVIEQDIFLFSTTLKENIAYGASYKVSDDKIIEIAKAAQAHEFITSFKEGYETIVGERGVTLSGGQKQRIAIARAFLADPKILILDDSSSAIDAQTEEKIQQAMDNLLHGRTVFIITHRLATIKRANKIIVLRKGQIVAQGDHQTLLRTSEDYRRIFGRHVELPPLEARLAEQEEAI